MEQTAKNIMDSIRNIATKFAVTDETKWDEDWIYYKINQVAADLKIKQYAQTNILDQSWLTDLGMVAFHKVNMADDINVSFCGCDVAKAFVPQVISFLSKDGNIDLGFYMIISACGKTQYYPKRMSQWKYTPADHTNSLFKYYWRINTSMYISDTAEKLRIVACLLDPTEGKLIESEPILSGAIVSGTSYTAKYGQIIYDGNVYAANSTFTGTAVTTFTGSGKVYLTSQVRAYRDTDPYPASGEMIRMIELEILTKEFGIERQSIVDIRNDSKDDSQKGG